MGLRLNKEINNKPPVSGPQKTELPFGWYYYIQLSQSSATVKHNHFRFQIPLFHFIVSQFMNTFIS